MNALASIKPTERPSLFAPGRCVQVVFTGHAPAGAPHATWFGVQPEQAARELLRRLARGPHEVLARDHTGALTGDVGVFTRGPAGKLVEAATVQSGLDAAELNAALKALAGAR